MVLICISVTTNDVVHFFYILICNLCMFFGIVFIFYLIENKFYFVRKNGIWFYIIFLAYVEIFK